MAVRAERYLGARVEPEESKRDGVVARSHDAGLGLDGDAARELEVNLHRLAEGKRGFAGESDASDRDVFAPGLVPSAQCIHQRRSRQWRATVRPAIRHRQRRRRLVGPNDRLGCGHAQSNARAVPRRCMGGLDRAKRGKSLFRCATISGLRIRRSCARRCAGSRKSQRCGRCSVARDVARPIRAAAPARSTFRRAGCLRRLLRRLSLADERLARAWDTLPGARLGAWASATAGCVTPVTRLCYPLSRPRRIRSMRRRGSAAPHSS